MSVVKSGYMRKHSKSILSGGWKQVWLLLYKDSNLVVYKKQGDSSPMGTINLSDVKKWFAYGEYTNGMPDRPSIPAGCSLRQILAIPQKPSSKAKIHWFLADTEQELHAWMDAICNTLPPPPQKDAPISQQSSAPVSSAPPPYSAGPSSGIGFDNVAAGPPMPVSYPQPSYTQQSSYSQQPPAGYHPPPPAGYHPPPPAAYPQQQGGYSQQIGAAYPQQGYYQPPPQYGPPGQAGYPQQQYYAPQGGYYQQRPNVVYQQQPNVVYQQKPKKGFLSGNTGKAAMGLIGGAALGYGASRLGGGLFGWGMRGSWSSLSSFGSGGSFGSFGSF